MQDDTFESMDYRVGDVVMLEDYGERAWEIKSLPTKSMGTLEEVNVGLGRKNEETAGFYLDRALFHKNVVSRTRR